MPRSGASCRKCSGWQMIDEYEALNAIDDAIALLIQCNANEDIITGLKIARRIVEKIEGE